MKNTLPNVPVYEGSLFTWSRGTGITEASELDRGSLWGLFTPLFADATDMGCYVRSHRTGAKKLFTITGPIHSVNDPREIVGWTLRSSDGVVINVFND